MDSNTADDRIMKNRMDTNRKDSERKNLFSALVDLVKAATPSIISLKILIDAHPVDDDHARFAYLNYQTRSDALEGKAKLDAAIQSAKYSSGPLDASCMTTTLKTVNHKRPWSPLFSIWVGNIFDASKDEVRSKFTRFGLLASVNKHGAPPVTINGGGSAIVNYVDFRAARAALAACAAGAVQFTPEGPPAIGRARGNVLLAQTALEALEAGEPALSFDRIRRLAADIPAPERPPDAAALLRACPALFAVDDAAMSVTAAQPPPPPAADGPECAICFQAATTALLPCGHARFCAECAAGPGPAPRRAGAYARTP